MRSKENDIDMYELQTKYRNFRLKQEEKQKELENSFNFNQSFDSVSSPMKFYLKNPINRSSQYNFINNIHNKMNTMKVNSSLKKKFFEYFKNNLFQEESDSIRRKYEMLKYSNDGIINKKSIPYAECYVKGCSVEFKFIHF